MFQEDRQAIVWELKDAATSMAKAEELERYRNTYFQDLYDDIVLFSVRYADISDEKGPNPSVESQALHIIDAKEAYDRKISKLKAKHDRWTSFLQLLDADTAAFVEYHIMQSRMELDAGQKRKLDAALKEWQAAEEKREKKEDQAAKAHLSYMKKKHPALFVERSRERLYLIDGEMVSMTQFEYDQHLRKKEEDAQDAKWQSYLSHKANELSNAL